MKQFMTRKRRKDRVEDWRVDYKALLGDNLVDNHLDVIDQVIPQSSVFLCGLAYEERVRILEFDFDDIISTLEGENFDILKDHLLILIQYAKGNAELTKSWPTLLKSQSFFDNVSSYMKGLVAGGK